MGSLSSIIYVLINLITRLVSLLLPSADLLSAIDELVHNFWYQSGACSQLLVSSVPITSTSVAAVEDLKFVASLE